MDLQTNAEELQQMMRVGYSKEDLNEAIDRTLQKRREPQIV